MPKVTVLMPLYNGIQYIRESLDSIQAQTFTDWEFIIVNDFGSDDGCADVIREYAEKDPRIKLVQAEERLGLAASLNVGLDMAQGEYVARVDADDPSVPERLEKQVAYLDAHPEVCLCSSWQRSITPTTSYIQKVAFEAKELEAAMLFGCEISHCGVMLRKQTFDEHQWRYDPTYLGEDFELWTRAMNEGAIMVNLPEPLVSHRWGFGNISIAKGESLRNEVRRLSMRGIGWLGVDTSCYDPMLFSGWRNKPTEFAKADRKWFLSQCRDLLMEIFEKNRECHRYDEHALKKVLLQRWDWARESCGISFTRHEYGEFDPIDTTPAVSVVLPTSCCVMELSKTIDSVLAQTYSDWELLVVNDFNSDDGTVELAEMYAFLDPRIRLIQAETSLGLIESLNLGMREAQGQYIARLDTGDTALPERFAKQVALMDAYPEIGICGTWQKHYAKDKDWVFEATADQKLLKCRLLFWRELCCTTMMLRRSAMLDHGLFFDPNAQAEDFDLCSRALPYMEIVNIPEVLSTCKDGSKTTPEQAQRIDVESGEISARTIGAILGIKLQPWECRLLNSHISPISEGANRASELERLKEILKEIWERNEETGFFDSQTLLQTLTAKWYWAKDGADWKQNSFESVRTADDAFAEQYEPSLQEKYRIFQEENPGIAQRAKKVIKRILRPLANGSRKLVKALFKDVLMAMDKSVEHWTWERFKRIDKKIEQWTMERFKRTDKQIEKWTWERYKRIEGLFQSAPLIEETIQNNAAELRIPYRYQEGERIRLLFLFQMPSFWPSWASLYESCIKDERFEVHFALLDEEFGDTTQMAGAREFLEERNIPYAEYSDLLLAQIRPHVLVLQTPYDAWHRMPHVRSEAIRKKGIRIVYIPYGVEIADTEDAHHDHFETAVINCWRVYTLSEAMRQEYVAHCINSAAVRGVGHPKFDGLYHKDQFPLSPELSERIGGRRIILWHLHFPKFIPQPGGRRVMATPYLEEYVSFAKYLSSYPDCFFIVQMHPKFLDCKEPLKQSAVLLQSLVRELENVYLDLDDDYRPSLLNADAIISDRSAVMIEAATVGVPVLYMSNADYYEPMTAAVLPLVESYEQGQTCVDMVAFVKRCRQGLDLNRDARNAAFRQCIPFFDGRCADRIKEDIVRSLEEEEHNTPEYRFALQTAQLEERLSRLEERFAERLNDQTALMNRTVSMEREQAVHDILPAMDVTKEQVERRLDDFSERMTEAFASQQKQVKDSILPAVDQSVEHWTWERYRRVQRENEQLRRQIDYTYRDIMVVLEKQLAFAGKHSLSLLTEHPLALDSLDTQYPHGTIRDNTRFPRFIKKCESIFGMDRGMAFLDLGCSGGGMVLDAALRGHLGIGLEGSDASLTAQRAEWRLLRDNLFTCDIAKPFVLLDRTTDQPKQFHVITAWEVLEHIPEADMPMLLSNIAKHLLPEGIFVASIANYDDIDPDSGVNWHVTLHPYAWWKEYFEQAGFIVCSELLDPADLARGGYNPPNAYLPPNQNVDSERCFHLVARRRQPAETEEQNK